MNRFKTMLLLATLTALLLLVGQALGGRGGLMVALVFAGFVELALQLAERGMELRLVLFEVQDAAHLLLSVAARAGIGHRQG